MVVETVVVGGTLELLTGPLTVIVAPASFGIPSASGTEDPDDDDDGGG